MRAEEATAWRLRNAQLVARMCAFAQGRVSVEAIKGALGEISAAVGRTGKRRLRMVQRRQLSNALVGAGMAADGRRRWKVEAIVRWRGGAKDRQALVRWAGFDRETGDAWPLEWVCRKDLTPDLRELGRLRAPPRPAAVIQRERDQRATRVRAKAARVELCGQWRGRMRSDGAAEEVSSEESSEASEEEAGVKRKDTSGAWEGRLRRRLDITLLALSSLAISV